MTETPRLWIVIPCYNEAEVLPRTAPLFRERLRALVEAGRIAPASSILFVNDGSSDGTWEVIRDLNRADPVFRGVCLSRNRGHQNALLCGLMEARGAADVVISADCDGQDDLAAIDEMVAAREKGYDVVYGCRSNRASDTWFKRLTAEAFYRLVSWLGGEVVFNHADYRLATARVLDALSEYGEVNLFLRGIFPMLGFRSTRVYYTRAERLAGESHYPLRKMLGFALDGITSLSVRPIRMIVLLGGFISLLSLAMIVWMVISYLEHRTVPGWASNILCVCLFGGIQLVSIGVIGEYVGKIYLETKRRPRYIVSDRI